MAEAKAQEAAKQDPKTPAGGEDLSMEEILHSIRKIIAEDDPEGKKPNGKAKEGEAVPGSDVLELTEMIKDDGSVVSLKSEGSTDIMDFIDEALKPAEKLPEKPPEKAVEKPPEQPVKKPPEQPAPPVAAAAAGDSLLSAETVSSAAAAFKKLKGAEAEPSPAVTVSGPHFRSGLTVEDMVLEMLRPMMKTWLDANLPQIVERIVEREVKKLTK